MAHDIQSRDVQVGVEQAWHGLTTVVPEITKENYGIGYGINKQPLFLPNGTATDFFICVADDDGKPISSPVTGRYTVIPNETIWDAVQTALAGSRHRVVSVGTVSNRERGFISVKLDDAFVAAGRKTESVLNVLWGHGGALNVIANSGFTVVVCRNTYNAALSHHGDFNFRIKHVGDATVQLQGMSEAIEAHTQTVEMFTEAMNEFHRRPISKDTAREFYAGFVVDKYKSGDDVSTRASNQYKRLYHLFHSGAGNTGQTAADLFNAATDFYTHENAGGTNKQYQRQFESSEFGAGQQRKSEVFELLSGNRVARVGDFEEAVRRGKKVLTVA